MPVRPTPPPYTLRPLPDRPSLEQFRRQARDLHRQALAGDADALAQVRRHFHARPGEPLTRAQAQLVLARSYGFDSWPKLKAHVDGVTRERLVQAVNAGDAAGLRTMLRHRPDMVDACTGQGEQRLIHLAIVADDAAVLRVLMDAGADARTGIWPHREATSPRRMAAERGLDHLVRLIDESEAQRQADLSCPNVTVSPEQDQLAALIRSGRNDEAIAMLEADPTLIKQCDRDGATPLHIAAAAPNAAMVDWLCEHRADARKVDAAGFTPIDRAVVSIHMWGHRDTHAATRIMRRLLQRGCAMTAWAAAALGDCDRLRQIHAETPGELAGNGDLPGTRGAVLTRAVIFDQIDAVRCLLDLGLDPNEPIPLGKASDDETAVSWGGPLWNAAAFGRHAIATLLLDRGADPNGNVYASGWPLDRAYERGDRAMVDLLYARGATPTPWTVCAAHDHAAARGMLDAHHDDAEVVRELVWSAVCCLSLPIVELALPRLMALRDRLPADDGGLQSWHDLLCQPMRSLGNDPNPIVRPTDYRPEDRFVILERMLAAGIDPNARGRFGLTTLHFIAARAGHADDNARIDAEQRRFAEILLDAGADAALRDELLCSTPLGWACRYGRAALVDLLLSRGTPPTEPDAPPWATPIAWAQKMNHPRIVEQLRAAGLRDRDTPDAPE